MKEAKIGRVLVASLHQAIADLAPTRLEFYEHWLNPAGLRARRLGLAPFTAVVGFLRQEAAYPQITARAGRYAAEWTVAAWPRLLAAGLRALPGWIRGRVVLWLATRLIRQTHATTRVRVAAQGGTAVVEIDGSPFCAVRRPWPSPLCGFYAAAIGRVLELAGVPAEVHLADCRALGAAVCRLVVVRRR